MPKPLSPIYALVGADSFLQMQALSDVLRAMPKDVQRVDLDGEKADLAGVLDELRSFAMFGGAKLVVVRDAEDWVSKYRDKIEGYAAAPSDSGTLVLRMSSLPKVQRIYKLIDKLGGIVACEPPSLASLPKWLVERGKKAHDVALAPDAAAMLADLIGDDLGKLDMELSKLALMSDDGKVDVKLVGGGVAYQREREMYELTNAMATGNATDAIRRWRQLLQTDASAEFRAVTWLGMWLEDVRNALTGNAGKLSWKYKDKLNQFMTSAKSLGPAGLQRALDLLAEVDKNSKSGVGDAPKNVERFILSVAKK